MRYRYVQRLVFIILILFSIQSLVLTQDDFNEICENRVTTFPMGESEQTIRSDNGNRDFVLYIPNSVDLSQSLPLVISFHGFSGNAKQQSETTKWSELAETEYFVVVYPQGAGFPRRWNAGETGFSSEEDADDVLFIQDLIAHLAQNICLDTNRIYANGFSNGGGMSHRLACELADKVTAVGTIAGAYASLPDGCNPTRPIPIISFHGDADPIVPYAGGDAGPFTLPSIEDWIMEWAERNDCDGSPQPIEPIGDVIGIRYVNCVENADVVLYTIHNGGHTWAGSEPDPSLFVGETNQDINTTEMLWNFFNQYTLEAEPEG